MTVTGPAGEYKAKTTEDGTYEILDVPEGKYEITVDAAGYEDQKAEVEVKKSGGQGSGGSAEGGKEGGGERGGAEGN